MIARPDVVAVPIRAAGGTRIKILEAFAYGVPVVSSPLGAEGLEVEHDRDIVIAQTLEELVSASLDLTEDRVRRRRLIDNAARTVADRYGPQRTRSDIDMIYGPVTQPSPRGARNSSVL